MITIDSMFEQSKLLFDYLSKDHGCNRFLIDEIESLKVRQMKQYIDANDKMNAIKLYRELDKQCDMIRDYYCYNRLPYRSSFRGIAKDLHLYLKDRLLYLNPDFKYIDRMLKFISTSDFYVIREYLIRRSYSLFYMERINIDPSNYPNCYLPIEVILDYSIKLLLSYKESV